MNLESWMIGLSVSLLAGGIATEIFVRLMRRLLQVRKPASGSKRFPPWLTGGIERLFFTTLVGLNAPGVVPAMMGWLALKMATNWNHPDWKEKPTARTLAYIALVGGLVSLFFAYLGGAVSNGQLCLSAP